VNTSERIGILIGKKSLNRSERELLGAGTLIDASRFRVTLLGKKKSKARRQAEDEGLEFVRVGKITKYKDFNAALRLSGILKEQEVTTVLFRDPEDSGLLVTTKFLMKGRLRLIFIQDRPISEMTRDFLLTFQFNQIDAWVTPLMSTAKNVKTATNLDHAKVHVFPLPVQRKPFVSIDENRSSDRDEVNGLRIGWNLPTDESTAARTAQRILDCMRQMECSSLVLNAPGWKEKNVFEFLPVFKEFKKRIEVTSYCTDQPDFYSAIDLCFIDPEYEPFEGVAVRCLFSGVAPIVPKSMVSNELFENGELAWSYDPSETSFDSGHDIFERVNQPDFRSKFRNSALKRIGKRYTRRRFKENLQALIEALPEKSAIR